MREVDKPDNATTALRCASLSITAGPATASTIAREEIISVNCQDDLTLRIIAMLASGSTATEIERTCHVSRATIWRRIDVLRREWGVETTAQVVVRAVHAGLI